jgi:hypothetical protein
MNETKEKTMAEKAYSRLGYANEKNQYLFTAGWLARAAKEK